VQRKAGFTRLFMKDQVPVHLHVRKDSGCGLETVVRSIESATRCNCRRMSTEGKGLRRMHGQHHSVAQSVVADVHDVGSEATISLPAQLAVPPPRKTLLALRQLPLCWRSHAQRIRKRFYILLPQQWNVRLASVQAL